MTWVLKDGEDLDQMRGKRILEHVTLFEIITVMPASNSLKAATSVIAHPCPSCPVTLVLESQDKNQVLRLQEKVRGKQSASQQTFRKPGFAPWKQKQGTVHGLLEMEGYECGFDREFQIFLANHCDLSLTHTHV